jgi:hypothetical protein
MDHDLEEDRQGALHQVPGGEGDGQRCGAERPGHGGPRSSAPRGHPHQQRASRSKSSSLGFAWHGEKSTARLSRGKSAGVSDPFAKVTVQLHAWFNAEPRRTGRELLERLQAEYPRKYADGRLRTLSAA